MKHKLSEAAREARNAYQREYYKRNPEKRQEHMARYWENKAKKAQTDDDEPVEE